MSDEGHVMLLIGSKMTSVLGADGNFTFTKTVEWEDLGKPELMIGQVDPFVLKGLGEEILAIAGRGIRRELLEEAAARYPKLVGKFHDHHLIPEYLGGSKGPLRRIPAEYHQFITNAFRQLAPYGQKLQRSVQEIKAIAINVCRTYPLP